MIPIAFGYTEGRSSAVNSGLCKNMVPCLNQQDAKSPYTLSERPGLKRLVRPSGNNGEVRAEIRIGATLYALVGNKFYSTNLSTLASTLKGTISTKNGKAWIEDNANSQIMIAAGNLGYVYNYSTDTFSQIADVDFPGAASMTFQDNYGLVVEPGTGRLWNSNLNDFLIWSPLDFVTAEADPDNLLAIIADHQQVIAMGEKTGEVYINVGDADAVFQRLQGGVFENGINAPGSLQKIANMVFYLDDSLQVRMLDSLSGTIISTDSIAFQMKELAVTSDGLGMTYIWNNHIYYVLTFPTAKRTFAYDLTESAKAGQPLWHQVDSYPYNSPNRWRGNSMYRHDGRTVYVGDYSNGWIYTLDEHTHQDNLQSTQRVFRTSPIFDTTTRNNLFHLVLEVEFEPGVGNSDVEDPQVSMRYSDDGAKTWSNELFASIGKAGEYENRARWDGLGESRNRVYEFMIADAVKVEAVGVYLQAEAGYH